MLQLAPYAVTEANSRGRRHDEPAPVARGQFQRDRDRIVHSTAFRRLEYKTQVFVNHEGDLFRTRLTHSIEVAQITRGIARELALNEDLAESIAFAHDLGHTPFGHAGQDALNACMKDFGGFEHNLQSLRTVDLLEDRYAGFDGLNLMFETREGILKHCSRRNAEQLEAREPGGVGRRFLLGQQPSLEAQLCNLADEIAYNAHDIDDGVRSGLITLEQLRDVPLFDRYRAQAQNDYPHLAQSEGRRRLLSEAIRRMLSEQVYDVIDATRAALAEHAPADVDAVRRLPALVGFSQAMRAQSQVLKRFLFQSLYRHPQVMQTTDRARQVVRDLFAIYQADPRQMPPVQAGWALDGDDARRARTVADFIAGMTDRFAAREHERLTGQRLLA